MNIIEIKVKIKLPDASSLKDFLKLIREIEKEYSCNCTLLEIEIN